MNFFGKVKFLFSNNFDQFITKYLAGEENSTIVGGSFMNPVQMKYSALFGCFRVLAETFATVPVHEYKKLSNGDNVETDDTGLLTILGNIANDEMSSYNFFEAMQYQKCAGGNAVAKRLYNKKGQLVGLFPIDYQHISIQRDKDTYELLYKLGNKDVLKRKDVFHVPGPSMNGSIGMSILEYAAQGIALGQSYETFGKKFYDNGAMPSGVFEHPSFLKDAAYSRLKEDLKGSYTGLMNSGKPMLLEHGLQYKQLTIKPIDAQMLENRRFQVEDVCRFCRVPLHMVGELSKATNNNIEHQSLEFVMYTMLPYFRRYEECINAQLLTPEQRAAGYYFQFDMNELLRGDAQGRAKAYATGRQWGWYSANDVRRKLKENSISNGDIYLQPVNMIEAGTIPGESEGAEGKPAKSDPGKQERPVKNTMSVQDIIQETLIQNAKIRKGINNVSVVSD